MTPNIPSAPKLMWPVLTAIRQQDGSTKLNELYERVARNEGFTEQQLAIPTQNGREPLIYYRIRQALSSLKRVNAATNSDRGVWTITEHGGSLTVDQMFAEHSVARGGQTARVAESEFGDVGDEVDGDGGASSDDSAGNWQDQLLECLWSLSPAGFERLSQLLLREAGFENVEVTGRSGDGGIDGQGTYRFALVSLPVYFQCKRYRGSVAAGAVRDFRGAMDGRSGNGLFITTGTFTREARREAVRDGARPIDLIDGTELCDLLHQHRLGVSVTERVIEEIAVRVEFFDEYR